MKLKKALNKVIPCFLTLAMVLTSVDMPEVQSVVKAAETSAKGTVSSDETEDVTLGNEALTTSGYANGWNQEQGLYVSYGQYDGKLTDYRLLQSDGKTVMFDADEILWIDHFEDSADQYDTNWQGTYL